MRSRWIGGLIAVVGALAVLAASCGNSDHVGGTSAAAVAVAPSESTTTTAATHRGSSGDGGSTASAGGVTPVDAPGVTDTEIRVGGVASVTNPLGGPYEDAFAGVQAYFDMVNSTGGVDGRKLVLSARRDDHMANNAAEVKGLLEQDDVFAALPIATLLFTGADQLAASGIPTFGWHINDEWQGSAEQPKKNMFGHDGSFLCLGCTLPNAAYMAKLAGRHRIGLLGYSVPQSAECMKSWSKSFDKWGDVAHAKVVFSDSSLSFGTTDLSVQVSKMKDARVDMVMTCMDTNGVVTLAKEIKKQQLDATQFLPNAYDQQLMREYGDLFQDSYLQTSFTPLESRNEPKGLKEYDRWIRKAGGGRNENSVAGWLNADLFVRGLRAAGPDFSRQKVIDAINAMTDYDAGGLLSGVNWTTAHDRADDVGCFAVVRIDDSRFVPVTGPDGQPFTCLDPRAATLRPTYR